MGEVSESEGVAAQGFQAAVDGFGGAVGGVVVEVGQHIGAANAVAVITGGASGLGRAVAERVIAAGGKAAILDLQEALGQAVAREMGASFFVCDVGVESNVVAAIEAARRAMGGINALVNCAGIVGAGKWARRAP